MIKRLGNPARLRVPRSLAKRSKSSKVSRVLALKDITNEAKNKPCEDCGKSYPPWVMDLDHIDPDKKKYTVSKMVQDGKCTEEALREEIAKCRVLCANCHRERTHWQAKERYRTKWKKKRTKKKSKSSITAMSDTWAT